MIYEFDHIVIGAGISGLGSAHFAKRYNQRTLILEASERIGGCINSCTFPELNGFWVEAGGHTCFNSYGNLLKILDDLDLINFIQAKQSVNYFLWRNNQRCSILKALHPLDALVSLPRIFTAVKNGRNVADYYGEILGRSNYQDLLRHAFQSVICQPADDYPAEALFRRKPRRKEVQKAFTFAQGLHTIPTAIAAQTGLEVRTKQKIQMIEWDGTRFAINGSDGERFQSATLTLAVPPDQAAALLPADFERVRAVIKEIGMAELATLVVVVRREDLKLPPLAGLIAVEDVFYSVVTRDFFPDLNYRGFAFHFRPQFSEESVQITHACRVLGIRPECIVAHASVCNRLPALRKGHVELVEQLDAALKNTRLGITGNWFLGVSIEDALTRSFTEITRLFKI